MNKNGCFPRVLGKVRSLAAKRSAVRSRYAPPNLLNKTNDLKAVDIIDSLLLAQLPHRLGVSS